MEAGCAIPGDDRGAMKAISSITTVEKPSAIFDLVGKFLRQVNPGARTDFLASPCS
jgi:hypothetical protein